MTASHQRVVARPVRSLRSSFATLIGIVTIVGSAALGTEVQAAQTIPTIPASPATTADSGPVAVVATTAPVAPVATAAPAPPAPAPPASTVSSSTAAVTKASLAAARTTTKATRSATTRAAETTKSPARSTPGSSTPTSTSTPTSKAPAPNASVRNAKGQWSPNGQPIGAALLFNPDPRSTDRAMPSAGTEADAAKALRSDGGPLFLLIVGSDARAGESVAKSRSDAVHVLAYNPLKRRGTLVGFPRDTWVTPPGASARKLSGVLSTGGPDQLVATMRALTGLPISSYVITGFDGFTKMVDALGGVDIKVAPAMNDKASGAQFQEGWFHMNGEASLAFNRARKTLPKGDLSRSANQERFLLATLGKLRSTTADVAGLTRWVGIARTHTVSNVKPGDWLYWAQVARSIDPAALTTAVAPGAPASKAGQSVVILQQPAFSALMTDLADAMVG